MSFDYNVAVHQANWPTAAALQSCMTELRYPVVLGNSPDAPQMTVREALDLPVRFKERQVELENSIVQLSPTVSFGYSLDRPPDAVVKTPELGTFELHQLRPDEVYRPHDINEDLARIGAKGVSFGNGDYVLVLSFRSSRDEIRAGFYIMAALIKCFGGYGFELQTGAHGAGDFADGMVADAEDEAN
jgi:hypothetical protein